MITTKASVRSTANEIDKLGVEVVRVVCEIDRTCDKIDSELNSCSREIGNSIKTLQQVKPLIDKLVLQVGDNAPEHIKVLVQSICTEILSKVSSAIDNQQEVQRNVKDIDVLTDDVDQKTDEVEKLIKNIDTITDKFQ